MSPDGDLSLKLPALRAHMGDWVYYITFMTMGDVANKISIAEDIHASDSLRELLQRRLTDRSVAIKDYLLTQEQRFFNALVVGTYGGNPEWNELAIHGSMQLPDPIEGALGILTLSGAERLFAVDGQHRVAGIRKAVTANNLLQTEELCVILVAGVSQTHRVDDPVGFERTRRLFTTLNRYAKPVSKRDVIALDEDDVVAITTRRLVDEGHPLFADKISLTHGKNIPVTDRKSFTTITALYDALDVYLRDRTRWTDFKKYRPSDVDVEDFYKRAFLLWDQLVEFYPPLLEMQRADPSQEIASRYRNDEGGHLLFRPVGLLLVVKVVKILVNSGLSLPEAVRRTAEIPMRLNVRPWAGLLWDLVNQRMLTAPENQKVALWWLLLAVGGDLTKVRTDLARLKKEYAGLLNLTVEEVELPTHP